MSKISTGVEKFLKEQGIKYKVLDCDPELADTAAFCEAYNFKLEQSANAIIVIGKSETPKFCCCLVLASTRLDVNKAVRKLLGTKKASFATAEQTRVLTGMEIGGVTPFGLPNNMPIYVDAAVIQQTEIITGGGNRSSKVLLDPNDLKKIDNLQIVYQLAKSKS